MLTQNGQQTKGGGPGRSSQFAIVPDLSICALFTLNYLGSYVAVTSARDGLHRTRNGSYYGTLMMLLSAALNVLWLGIT